MIESELLQTTKTIKKRREIKLYSTQLAAKAATFI